jgi:ADP-heptose:LPS heptosyltransferase
MSDAVLAVRLRALGDIVLVTPALRALRNAAPGTTLEVVTERRYADLVAALPGVSRVWPLERTAAATLALARELGRRRYRLAVDFFGNPRSALLVARAGAERRAGYILRGRDRVYDVRVPRTGRRPDGRGEYAADTHVRLAEAAGGRGDGEGPRLVLEPAWREEAAGLLERAGVREPQRTLGLVAAGTWPTKTWPASHAAALARRLIQQGREVLLVRGPGEEAVTGTLRRLVPALKVMPPSGVTGLVAALARLGAVIGTDSGPRHIAAALGVPTFAWFGPTHPDHWQPPGASHGYWFSPLPCRGCDRTRCPHWSCMPGLSPAEAGRLVITHLERFAAAGAAVARGG